jgi:glycolate oxidase FAD binding subunit
MSDDPNASNNTSVLGNHREERPQSIEAIQTLVGDARTKGDAIYPVGAATMLSLGHIPTRPGMIVNMTGLDRVIDYPARDMTITVQAGITISRLQEILRAERQQLAVDIPLPDRATLGGAIAANASGPRRYGLGTLRDYVIGISIVNDEGQVVKAGGRVVKNVAGYDLMKLYTGSLGTLGIISQVTLKLKPLPEAAASIVIPMDPAQTASMLDLLHATRTRPVCIESLSPAACQAIERENSLGILPQDGKLDCLVVGFEDNAKSVAWQVEQLKQELPAEARATLRECSDAKRERLMAALRDFVLHQQAVLSLKATMLTSAVADFRTLAATVTPAPWIQAHAGNGIVYGHFSDLALEQARPLLEKLTSFAVAARGNLIVTRCPAEWKTVLPIWGQPTGDRIVMKAVKAKLDPNHIFNPGRFVDGI